MTEREEPKAIHTVVSSKIAEDDEDGTNYHVLVQVCSHTDSDDPEESHYHIHWGGAITVPDLTDAQDIAHIHQILLTAESGGALLWRDDTEHAAKYLDNEAEGN